MFNGARILVTRPAHQAQTLCEFITQHGGEPVCFPTLDIKAIKDTLPIQNTLARLSEFDWVVFTSTNAVDFAQSANNGKIPYLASIGYAAVGKATAKAMRQAGLSVDITPETDFSSEGLLAMPQWQSVQGQRFLCVRGRNGREKLAHVLQERGAIIDYLDVYERLLPDSDSAPIETLIQNNKLAVLTATSGEALHNLVKLLSNVRSKLLTLPLIVMSSRIKQLAIDEGFTNVIAAPQPSDNALFETIATTVMGKYSDRID